MADDTPQIIERRAKDDGERPFATAAVMTNRMSVVAVETMVRVAFGDQVAEAFLTNWHTQLVMPIDGAEALAEMLTRIVEAWKAREQAVVEAATAVMN